jgi:hypothetical protein
VFSKVSLVSTSTQKAFTVVTGIERDMIALRITFSPTFHNRFWKRLKALEPRHRIRAGKRKYEEPALYQEMRYMEIELFHSSIIALSGAFVNPF